jgi:hypothetical protein
MYWIYLVIFTLIVFIPSAIRHGFYGLNVTQTQEFATLLGGSFIMLVFLLQEKRLKKNLAEKSAIRKTTNRITKDLTQSYSYIGEVNRKLDILEQTALHYPESANLSVKKQKEMYDSVMEAIRLLGKSDEFSLRFIRLATMEILKEIRSFPDLELNFSCKKLGNITQIFESDEFTITPSPRDIDGIIACIVIKKKTPNHKIVDFEILKVVASQALLFFMFIRNSRQTN